MDKFFNETRFKQLIGILRNSRPNYRRAFCGKNIHPAIYDISRVHNPLDWHQLILEFPHMATDGVSIGYYRRDSDVSVKVTTCKIGKYIKRHFPIIADNIIRDFVAPYIIKTEILEDMDSILDAVINGPRSCMANDEFDVHPYRCYNPKFGWKLVVKKSGSDIVGRALINGNNYVRAYTSSTSSITGMSIDCALEAWLDSQGYENLGKWKTGTKLAKIERYGQLVAPYIDGHNDNVNDCGDYLKICNDGEYECQNTSGYAEEKNKCTCSHCGDRMHDEDSTYIDDYGDVCEDCLNNEFTYIQETKVNGRYRGGFYILNADTIETIEGETYPNDSYSDFDIVCLHNGDFTHLDNAIFDCDSEEYYHTDDLGDLIAYCEDDNEYHSDFWQCAESGNYYSENQDFAYNSDGDKIHPDYASDDLELVVDK